MKPSKVFVGVCLILLGISILSACKGGKASDPQGTVTTPAQADEEVAPVEGEAATSAAESKDGSTTLILIEDEITTLEPYRMARIHPDGSVASHLWDTLTWLDDDLRVEPRLAESWTLVNDLTWEFALRQGIIFHNGEPLNAEAVRFSIERAQSLAGSVETFAEDIGLERVEVVDDYTLRLVTSQPVANLPFHLAFLEILPPVYYSETPLDQLAVAPVGSGPYRLDQWIPGQGVVLEAISTYWGGTPTLPRLVFQTVPRVEERLATLRDGKAALVTDLSPTVADGWDSQTGRLQGIESTKRIFIGMRVEAGSPLEDKRVRQALNYGVNVEQVVDNWLGGYGEPYGSWVNPPADNVELSPWPYDPDRARDLLAEAGYPEGFTTTLRTPAGVYCRDVEIAKDIAQQLGAIGVDVEVETVDWTNFVYQMLSGDVPPLFLLGLNSRGDGLEDLKNVSATFAFCPTGWRSEPFEDTLKQALGTFNESARLKLMLDAQVIAYEEAPWIWLWREYDFYGIDQGLDWTPRRDGLVYLYEPPADSLEDTE